MFFEQSANVPEALITVRHNIALLQAWAAQIAYKQFCHDTMRRYAVQYAFIVIGEALKDVPRQLLEHYGPDIPWRQVIGFRDWLAHTYDDQPDPRILETIQSDLPELDRAILAIMNSLENPT